jgi:hypothetical protein
MTGALVCFGFLALGIILISLSTKNSVSGIQTIYKVAYPPQAVSGQTSLDPFNKSTSEIIS